MKSPFRVLLLSTLSSFALYAQTRMENEYQLRQTLGTAAYSPRARIGAIKIAVLDNGFGGYAEDADLLPVSTLQPTPPNDQKYLQQDTHGLGMAQILWGLTGRMPEGPEMYLLNARGYTNFQWAVDYAIEKKVDIILYSQTWEFGGQFDGRGFLNEIVNRATRAGILWINAAGNHGGQVYNGSIETDSNTGLVRLPGPGNTLRFRNKLDANRITAVLSWSDFTEDSAYKTQKDLDIHLYNDMGEEVSTTHFIQRGEAPPAEPQTDEEKRLSAHAREEFTVTLPRGDYTLKIEDRSQNFSASDRLRVTLFSDRFNSIDFQDHSSSGEINIPADNPNVITVGNCSDDSAQGPTTDGRSKPDLVLSSSEVRFTDGRDIQSSSSNAAAMFAGVIATLMASEPAFDESDLRRYLDSQKNNPYVRKCRGAPVWKTPSPAELIQITR